MTLIYPKTTFPELLLMFFKKMDFKKPFKILSIIQEKIREIYFHKKNNKQVVHQDHSTEKNKVLIQFKIII